jgi:gliding motility-associated-like protein
MGVTDGILFTPLLVGTETYTVTGTNASNGCQNTASIEVEVFNAPNVVAHVDEIEICLGETVLFSGSGADTYTWDMGVTNGIPFTPMSLGLQTYTVTGSVAGLTCTDTDQINVTVNALPTILFTADTTKVCIPYTINFSSSNSGASFEWEFGDGTSATGPTTSHTYMNPGSFDVTLTVTNAASCINSETYPAYIIADNLPVASFSYSPTVIDVSNTNVEFTNTSIGADTYEWNFSDGSAISTVMHPTHQFPEVGNAQYSVELVAKNNAGCIATYEQLITIDDILSFYIPNAFTPDGDLFNDTFLPIFDAGLDIYDYHLIIFNRWGETVFESFNVAYGWDGTYGSSNTVEDGTYIWQIEYGVTMSDKKYVMNGHVTILK